MPLLIRFQKRSGSNAYKIGFTLVKEANKETFLAFAEKLSLDAVIF